MILQIVGFPILLVNLLFLLVGLTYQGPGYGGAVLVLLSLPGILLGAALIRGGQRRQRAREEREELIRLQLAALKKGR